MTTGHQQQLANERAADARYRELLAARGGHIAFDAPANIFWTCHSLPKVPLRATGGLVGRVALKDGRTYLDVGDFYIAQGKHVEEPGLMVFSWVAPVADVFYRKLSKGKANVHVVELFGQVSVIRSLQVGDGSIVDYTDDQVAGPVPDEPFARRGLTVPAPPTGAAGLATPRAAGPANPATGPSSPQAAEATHAAEPLMDAGHGMRAEAALLSAIAAPRRDILSSVLSTLQPDQYALVTRDHSRPVIIQGHPGTGKTIIAAHRAAYLTHAEAQPTPLGRVLVIGPTDHYVSHIKGVIAELWEGQPPHATSSHAFHPPRATSMRELLAAIGRLDNVPAAGGAVDYRDVDWALGRFVDDAARLLKRAGRLPDAEKSQGKAAAAVYEAVRANRAAGQVLTRDPVWEDYLRRLPTHAQASAMGRHLPLLAHCGWSAAPDRGLDADHVIVDEAQDVSPLEWRLIAKINPKDSWTILGDLNQRRSDWTYHSWHALATDLGLSDDAGNPPLEIAGRGYRTTSAIMQYAARLLPRAERSLVSLQQDGVPPTVTKVAAGQVHAKAVADATRLHSAHPGGTVAIISTTPREAIRALTSRGFQKGRGNGADWSNGPRRVWVLDPEQARGLEFDAVVVVEPGRFPKNLGRHGLLYTSLTRANRELAVVHSAGLPDALRR